MTGLYAWLRFLHIVGLVASAREAKDDAAIGERLSKARPVAAAAVGGLGLLILIFLMVFKPF